MIRDMLIFIFCIVLLHVLMHALAPTDIEFKQAPFRLGAGQGARVAA